MCQNKIYDTKNQIKVLWNFGQFYPTFINTREMNYRNEIYVLRVSAMECKKTWFFVLITAKKSGLVN